MNGKDSWCVKQAFIKPRSVLYRPHINILTTAFIRLMCVSVYVYVCACVCVCFHLLYTGLTASTLTLILLIHCVHSQRATLKHLLTLKIKPVSWSCFRFSRLGWLAAGHCLRLLQEVFTCFHAHCGWLIDWFLRHLGSHISSVNIFIPGRSQVTFIENFLHLTISNLEQQHFIQPTLLPIIVKDLY